MLTIPQDSRNFCLCHDDKTSARSTKYAVKSIHSTGRGQKQIPLRCPYPSLPHVDTRRPTKTIPRALSLSEGLVTTRKLGEIEVTSDDHVVRSLVRALQLWYRLVSIEVIGTLLLLSISILINSLITSPLQE
ncbi:hypothetical protein LENED_002559 [Lentinula edodes]|uniref:Uncharacterized protein n=1 Tax=Lentinula edodes TaxID=5353 RepID=A0A1Q3E154_LENED|nr:hypothetical protein LENED_002559 [Lentinula edodes]